MSESQEWWKERVIYQIYPRSFQDSNGDGIGDIPGIISRLDNLADLGIGIIWLSPVYCSPDADNGYDISDYKDIDPRYGTLADMEKLIAEAGKRDIKIVMDLVINHTSDQHEWFKESRNPDSPYRDYYIWRPGRGANRKKMPNNWTSFFSGKAWKYDEQSGEYYLHLFAEEQPDLNWQNPKVMEEIQSVMRFWLDKGVAGFRCDVINVIYKTTLDNGRSRIALTGLEHYLSQEGNHEILRRLQKEVLSNYNCFTVGETAFVTPQMARDLCEPTRGELDMLFSFEHMETDCWFIKWFPRNFNLQRFARTIARWQKELHWNANYLENHDQRRCVSRFGNDGQYWRESATMLATLLLTIKGTPFIYQGQEIGMTNFDFTSMDQIQDVESKNIYKLTKKLLFSRRRRWKLIQTASRDNCRTPVQWTSGEQAGFTTGSPWLGINANHKRINMENQVDDPQSIRSWYKKLIDLRKQTEALREGNFNLLKASRNIMAYSREVDSCQLIIILNFSAKKQTVNFKGELLLANSKRRDYDGSLSPFEAVILRNKK